MSQWPTDSKRDKSLEEGQAVAETLSNVEAVRFAVFFRSVIGV